MIRGILIGLVLGVVLCLNWWRIKGWIFRSKEFKAVETALNQPKVVPQDPLPPPR